MAENLDSEESADSSFDIRAYWEIILKGRWAVVLALLATVAGVGFWTYNQPRIFKASASIIIEANAPQVLNNVDEVSSGKVFWITKEFYETEYKIMKSRDVAHKVVEAMGLDKDLKFLGLPPGASRETIQAALARSVPEVNLASRVMVEPVKDSKIVNISIEDEDPRFAAKLANAVTEAYIEYNLEVKLGTEKSASHWLETQLGDLKSEVKDSETALYQFKRDHNILSVSLEDQLNMNSSRLTALNQRMSALQVNRFELQAKRKAISDLQKAGVDPYVVGAMLKTSLATGLKDAENKARAAILELSPRYGDEYPKIKELRKQLEEIHAQLVEAIQNELAALDGDFTALLDDEKKVKAALEYEKQQALDLNKLSIEYNQKKREAENNLAMHGIVMKRLKETDLTSLLKTNNLRRLESALVPPKPVRPRPLLNMLAATGIGLLAGIGVAFLIDFLDSTVKTQEDVEKVVGLPFLGILPTMAEEELKATDDPAVAQRERDLYVLSHPRSPVAECHRSVRTNIMFMSPDRPVRRLLVTSASPREGKSTTAIGLAATLAQSGSRVILLDTDMRRPRLHRALGLSNERGISTYVVGDCGLEDAVKHTEIPQLDALPCGPVPPNPAELLHTQKFRELIQTLSGRYDWVIFDSPPVIAVTDAMVLATQVDGVMVVVKSGVTSKDLLRQAKRKLGDVNANVIGVVLNDLDVNDRKYGTYYAKYYRYGYYYGEERDSAKA